MKKKLDWTLRYGDNAFLCKINVRPNIEETEINFLNSKMWLPRASEEMNLSLSRQEATKLLEDSPKELILELSMYGSPFEYWTVNVLELAKVEDYCHSCCQLLPDDENVNVTMTYNQVRYQSVDKPKPITD